MSAGCYWKAPLVLNAGAIPARQAVLGTHARLLQPAACTRSLAYSHGLRAPTPPRSDVPLAWKLLWEGFGWPLRAFAEYKNGSLMEDDAKIVSPAALSFCTECIAQFAAVLCDHVAPCSQWCPHATPLWVRAWSGRHKSSTNA